jgi:hypothetical protein
LDFADGTITITGISFHYTVPHDGLAVADHGRLVLDLVTGEVLFLAGSSDVFDEGLTAICPLLA